MAFPEMESISSEKLMSLNNCINHGARDVALMILILQF